MHVPDAAPSPVSVDLRAGALRLALRPDLGGAVAGFWHGDRPILRSVEPEALEASRPSACYPLVPYSNRIGHARFRWDGHDHATRPNFGDSPHAVHGVGWLRPWQVVSSDADKATIRLAHPGDADWPFAFEVLQRFALAPDALTVDLVFTNTDARSQPVGLGWHPYFPTRSRSRLHAELSARWDSDATELPVRRVAQPGLDGEVADLDVDNCYDGWQGTARIRDELFSLELTSSADRLVVYTPKTKPYFCVEPVSHVSNAIQMADPLAQGLWDVGPGGTREIRMRLGVELA